LGILGESPWEESMEANLRPEGENACVKKKEKINAHL
jgi:hypothetical protein